MPGASELTPKQEAFALQYVETGSGASAYRAAYDVGEDTLAKTVWEEASRVLSDPKVSARVMELQAEAAERTLVTVQSITEELEEARSLAKKEGQSAAAVSASMGKAKLHGLLIDKQEHSGEVKVVAVETTFVRPDRQPADG